MFASGAGYGQTSAAGRFCTAEVIFHPNRILAVLRKPLQVNTDTTTYVEN